MAGKQEKTQKTTETKKSSPQKKKRDRTNPNTEYKNRRKKSVKIATSNVGRVSVGEAMRRAGYSPSYADNPQRFMRSKNFKELLDQYLSDEEILLAHRALKDSRRLDHMVFPIHIDDEEIGELLASVNCMLRKVVHGESAKHAYFWVPENRARKDAIDMAYKLKGMYMPQQDTDAGKGKYRELSDEELAERRKQAVKFLKKKN